MSHIDCKKVIVEQTVGMGIMLNVSTGVPNFENHICGEMKFGFPNSPAPLSNNHLTWVEYIDYPLFSLKFFFCLCVATPHIVSFMCGKNHSPYMVLSYFLL